jgi:hypothetical protein
MSLGEFRYWLAHGGRREYEAFKAYWALEAAHERQRQARAALAGSGARPGLIKMRLE